MFSTRRHYQILIGVKIYIIVNNFQQLENCQHFGKYSAY